MSQQPSSYFSRPVLRGPAPPSGLRRGLSSHRGQYLSQESYQRIERVEASGLPRHHMLDAPDEVSAFDIGLRVKLEDKRTPRGQEGLLRGRNVMRLTLSLSHTHNVFFLFMTPAAYQQSHQNTSHYRYNLGLSWGELGCNLSLFLVQAGI